MIEHYSQFLSIKFIIACVKGIQATCKFSFSRIIIGLTLGSMALSPLATKATHISGSDITYRWLSGNSYEVTVTLYRDCSGVDVIARVNLNYRSVSCNSNLTAVLSLIPGTGIEITQPCSSNATTCNGGTNPGIQQYIYRGTITLPAQCTDWVFSYRVCARNCAITTLSYTPSNCNGIPCLYVEATLNNVAAPTNSSPTFTNVPVAFVCIGQPFNYNHGAVDANGDSLVYSFVTPKDNSTTNVSYISGHSATQPLLSIPPMALNSRYGDISMTPTTSEVSVLAVLVREYRNGVLIGSIIRDIQVWTQVCSNILPTATGINGTSNFSLIVCAGTPFNFTIYSNDSNAGQIVSMSWNYGIPGATFNTNGSPFNTGTFSWSPTAADARAQPYSFTVTVRDNNCPSNGFQIYSYSIFVVNITAPVITTNSLCSGIGTGTASVTAGGGTPAYTYLWSPGGATTSSLTGLFPGNYSVTVSDSKGCSVTVPATVASQSALLANINSSSNVSCYGGNNGTATVSVIGGSSPYFYSWSPSGGSSAVASGLSAGNYTVTITDANNCTRTSTVSIVQPAVLTASIPSHTNASCFGGNNAVATVLTSGGTGPFDYSWSPSGGISANATGLSAGNYSVTISDAHGCNATALVFITQPTSLNLSASGAPATCGNANGSTSTSISGGTAPYTYLWSPGGATTSSLSGVSAGARLVTVTDANGCSASASAAVSNIGGPSASIAFIAPVSCFGGNNGSAAVSVSGGIAPLSYSWFPSGGTTSSATGLAAGNYTVTIRDGNNCLSSVSANVVQPSLIQLTPSSSDLTCFGSANGSASVGVTGGSGPYAYLWSPGGNTSQSLNGIAAGFFSVAVTDLHGCSQSTAITVSQPATLSSAIASSINVTCNGNNNGSAIISTSGGFPPYVYSWSPSGGAAAAAAGLGPGNYTVTVTDANNCIRTTNVLISQPAVLSPVPSAFNVLCSGGTGSASVVVSGGTAPYTYSWSPVGGTSSLASGLAAGNYTINVTDARNCSRSAAVSISQPTPLTANILQSSAVSCFGGNNGSASVVASGGAAPYTYLWAPSGGTNSIASGLASGNYTVSVRDAHNCVQTTSVSVSQPVLLAASIPVSTNVACFGGNNGSATVSVTGGTAPYSYNWSAGNVSDTLAATGLSSGNYSVTVSDALGCIASSSISISQPTALSVSATSVSATCGSANGSASTTASGGSGMYSFLWSPSGATTTSISGLVAGVYSVMVTDAQGCSVSTSAAVSNVGGPSVSVAALSPVSCFGGNNGSAAVSISGGAAPFTYSWFPSGGTSPNATGLSAGNYTVTIRDSNNCASSVSANVVQPLLLQLNSSSADLTCFGSSNGRISVTAIGGAGSYSYLWFPGGSTSQSLNGIAAGTYSVAVTDLNGCSQSTSITVTQPAVLNASIFTSSDVSCLGSNNGSATVVASGGATPYAYSWSPSGGTAPNAAGLAAGNYTVIITDANNCVQNTNVVISEPLSLSVVPTVTNASCYGTLGSAFVHATGGTSPYSYAWAPTGGTSALASGLPAGNYSVTVTDENNCLQTSLISISHPALLASSVPVSSNASCYGSNNGSATVAVSGGTAPYFYSWFPSGGNASSASGLAAGNYVVTITDANNCLTSIPVSITQPQVLSVTTTSTAANCYGDANGSASALVTGGTSPFAYSWNSGSSNSSTNSGLAAGNYSVTVTDLSGCAQTSSVTVSQPTALSASIISSTDASCFGNNNGTAMVTTNGGSMPYHYLWSPSGGTSSSAAGLAAGNYSVLVTDRSNCIQNANVAISQPPLLNVIPSATNASCAGGNGSASVVASGGTAPYFYSWSPTGGNTDSASVLAPGNYSVNVTDSHNCFQSAFVVVSQPSILVATIPVSSAVLCFGGNDGSATVSVSGGTTPYVYSWFPSGGTSDVASGISAGTYMVRVTDAHQCTQTSSVLITQPTLLSASIPVSANASCFGDSNGSATVSAMGGTAPYSYVWSPSGGFASSASSLTAGNYSVLVSDAHGCNRSTGIRINEPGPVLLNATSTSASCYGLSNGSTRVDVLSGGTPPFFFNWFPLGGNNHTAYNLSSGIYLVTVNDGNGCLQSTSIAVNQPTAVSLSINSTDVSCYGNNNGSAAVNASGGTPPYTYLWSPGGSTNSGNNNLTAGMHSILVTDYNQCIVTENVIVHQPEVLSMSVQGTATICIGQSANLSVHVSGGTSPYRYHWSNGNANTSQTVTPATTTIYLINVHDANGCALAQQDLTITVHPPLSVTANGIPRICQGDHAFLSALASGGNGVPYSYSWNQGTIHGNSMSVAPLHDTTFTVIVTDGCGTPPATDSVSLRVNPLPAISFLPHLMQGCVPVQADFFNHSTAPSGSSLIWNFGDHTTSHDPNPSHQYSVPGHYDVSLFVLTPEGCSGFLAVPNAVTAFGFPTAGFDQSTNVVSFLDPNVQFNDMSVDAVKWEWNFGDGSPTSRERNPVHAYADTGNFNIRLAVQSAGGCVDSTHGLLRVEDQFAIYIPNAFTPNGDGINDGFIAFGVGYSDYDMRIVDRWGKLIFHSTSKTQPWDGTFFGNENPCQNDVYVYIITAYDKHHKERTYIGHVTLTR